MNSQSFIIKEKIGFYGCLISVIVACSCLTINVDRVDTGSIFGTFVVKSDVSDRDIETTRANLRMNGVAAIGVSIVFLFFKIRSARGEKMFTFGRRGPVYKLIFIIGMALFMLGLVGSYIFVKSFGTDSTEFNNYFIYIASIHVAGVTLTLIGG